VHPYWYEKISIQYARGSRRRVEKPTRGKEMRVTNKYDILLSTGDNVHLINNPDLLVGEIVCFIEEESPIFASSGGTAGLSLGISFSGISPSTFTAQQTYAIVQTDPDTFCIPVDIDLLEPMIGPQQQRTQMDVDENYLSIVLGSRDE
jgi:hypothetical protein